MGRPALGARFLALGKFGRRPGPQRRRSFAVQTAAEFLEPRRLLSGITSTVLQAAVASGVTARLTSTGAAELSLTPSGKSGIAKPDFVELDSNPQISAQDHLNPFSTAAPSGLLPAQVRHAYGVDQITFGSVVGDGTGQTIAIVDAYDYPTASTDLHAFDVATGLADPPSFTRVSQTGTSSLPGTDTAESKGNDWEVEEALDVEWSHAMAPGASIVLVEANSDGDADLISAAVAYARSAPGVVAVSMSFGQNEDSSQLQLDSLFTTPSGHGGVTFLASTGDSGAPGYYPAYSPNVVAVGGTTLNVNSSGGYLSETGWSGSGGGISSLESQPGYQAGLVTQSSTNRTIPDVSFDADPNTGVSVYDTYDFGTSSPWVTVGGTSVSSPAWAGLIAVADQGRSLGGGTSLDGIGKTLPKLYSVSQSDFHDVTSGNNGYAAGPGYDLVTGRGSPVTNKLIPLLAAAGPFVTSASPTGIQSDAPTSFTFDFSSAMNTSSFSVATGVDSFTGPHSVNLISYITGYSWVNSTTLQINFTAPAAQGAYTMVIGPQILSAGGPAMDQNQNGVTGEIPGDEYSATLNYDNNPLAVASTSPASSGIINAPSSVLSVTFNQPIDPVTVKVSNLIVSQGTVSAVSVLSGNSIVQYTISGLAYEGTLTASLAVGALEDANDNPLLTAYTGNFAIDVTTAALPVPFTQSAPAGSLIYNDPGVSGGIQFVGDTDSYNVNLDANQTLTITATGAASLQPTLKLTDPNSNLLGSVTASAAGKSVILQTAPVATAGLYTITIGGSGSTTGSYALGATLNASINADNFGGSTNQTLATAQNINGGFLALGGTITRGAVTGAPLSGSSFLQDYYSFPLNAGDSITLAVNAVTTGSDSVSLYNAAGTLLASGSAGPANIDQTISNFIAPTTGTFYALVSASSGSSAYNLTVVRNAVFSQQAHNSFSTSQSLGTTQGALGDLTASSEDWYSVNVNSTGNVLAFSTSTPAQGSGEFTDSLNPHLQIYDPNDNLVASGSKLADGLNESISYQPTVTGTYRVRILSQNSTSGEYVLKAGNALQLNLPTSVTEGQGTVNGTLGASSAPSGNLTVTLTSSDPSRISVPSSIVLPSGQTSVTVPLTVIDDSLLNGPEPITITATGGTYFSTSEVVTIHDNETAVLTVSLPGTALKNGGTVTGSINSSAAPSQTITVSLSSNLTSALTVPVTITLLAGQTTATFTATIVQNGMITGTEAATVNATVEHWTSGSATINITDTNETVAVGLPASGWEGQTFTTDTITLGGTVSSSQVINLLSSNTSQLTVPGSVTVPAGQSTVSFGVTLLNSGVKTGSHTAIVTASATGFNSGGASIIIHDSNLDHLGFTTISSPQQAGVPFSVTVSAYNIVNEVIAVYNSGGTVTAAGQHGNLSVAPSSVTFSSGVWTGNVTLTTADSTAALTMSTNGVALSSNNFAIQGGAVSSLAWSTVAGQEFENVPFTETVTATDAYGNTASSFNGSLALSGLVGSTNYQNLLGTNTFVNTGTGGWSYGFYFSVTSNYLATAVRSFYGTDVTIFDSSGNAIQSQAVSGTPGVWTQTSLATPLQLYSGTQYLLNIYSGSNGPYYLKSGKPTHSSFVSIGTSWYAGGDTYPVYSLSNAYPAVDLSGIIGSAYTTATISPTSAAFINGVWTGNINVPELVTGIHLHADDGSGQTADSNTFNVIAGQSVALNASAGNIEYYLELDSAAANLQVWQLPFTSAGTRPVAPTGSPTATYPLNTLANVALTGSGSANVALIVDQTNGTIQPAGGLSFSGGSGATGDYLTMLLPASGATVSVAATSLTTGSENISYSNLSAIVIDGSTGNDTVIQNAQPGAPLTFNGVTGNDTLTINAGTFVFTGNPALATANLTLNDHNTVSIAASTGGIQTLGFAQINIGPGDLLAIASAANHSNRSLVVTTGLSIFGNGKLDVGSNDLLIHTGSISTLNNLLSSGFNAGAWNGSGIDSSSAAQNATHLTALGMLLNNNGSGNPIYSSAPGSLGLFDGQSPLVTDVLVKYTYYGDANLDDRVDSSDYSRIDNGFLSQLSGWSNGDFNYDGVSNGTDYTLIDNAFNSQGATLAAQVKQSAHAAAANPSASDRSAVTPTATLQNKPQGTHLNPDPFRSRTPIAFAASATSVIVGVRRNKPVHISTGSDSLTTGPWSPFTSS